MLFEQEHKDFKCKFLIFDSGDRYILGNPFFQNYYVVFDVDSSVVGVGQNKVIVNGDTISPEPFSPEPIDT